MDNFEYMAVHLYFFEVTLWIITKSLNEKIRSDQSLSHVRLFATPWSAAHQTSLSITNSRSSLRLMSIESVMPSSHLILCHPLLLLPPIPPSIRVFSNESTLRMRWRNRFSQCPVKTASAALTWVLCILLWVVSMEFSYEQPKDGIVLSIWSYLTKGPPNPFRTSCWLSPVKNLPALQ